MLSDDDIQKIKDVSIPIISVVDEAMSKTVLTKKYRVHLIDVALSAALNSIRTFQPDPEKPDFILTEHAKIEVAKAVSADIASLRAQRPVEFLSGPTRPATRRQHPGRMGNGHNGDQGHR